MTISQPRLCGWSLDSPPTTHAAAAVVRIYFLMVRRTPLFVSDRCWIAEEEAAVFTASSSHPTPRYAVTLRCGKIR